jgi:hypothetical protein
MNETQKRALRAAIGNAGDNLHRAKMQQKANPYWRSGNGESIDNVVDGYQREYDELREGIA